MNDNVIQTKNLTFYYGKHRGIENVDLEVKRGEIFGFLGPNGAGKTTTQRILLDLMRPTAGTATIFGLDCHTQGTEVRKRIGYLPGELSLYQNLKGGQLLELLSSIHGAQVDTVYRKQLCERLDLDTSRKIKEYSKGNKQKIGVVAAFMAKPDLLILDEPTSGLDPLVQQTVLEFVREARADGRTVFFSSHILPEVQAVCDRVGIIREGQLIKTDSVDALTKQQFKRVHLTLTKTPPQDVFTFNGVEEVERMGNEVRLKVYHNLHDAIEKAVPYGIEDIDTPPVTLEEIFLGFYGRQNGGNNV